MTRADNNPGEGSMGQEDSSDPPSSGSNDMKSENSNVDQSMKDMSTKESG